MSTPLYVRAHRPISYIISAILFLVASLFLWLCAFSTPYINSIYYVGLQGGSGERLGTFGWCAGNACISPRIGYDFPLVPASKSLTGSLILTAVAAGLANLAFITLMGNIKTIRGGIWSLLLAILAILIALISFALALIAFVTFHHRSEDRDAGPRYGPAMWLHLTACVLLVIAFPFILIGLLKQRHDRKHGHVTTTTTGYGY